MAELSERQKKPIRNFLLRKWENNFMEVKVRPLNRGETFSCSVKTAKEMFKNTDVYLNFAYLGRDYRTWAETPDAYYWKRNVNGRIIAKMQTRSGEARPILCFFVVKESAFPLECKIEFEQKYLPEFYRLYETMFHEDSRCRNTKLMITEYIDNKLKLHETSLHWR